MSKTAASAAPDDSDLPDSNRLSRINTRYSLLRDAHGSDEEKAGRARIAFFERYDTALRNYFFGIAKGDQDLAEDAYSGLKIKFLMGKLQGYTPERGLFRNFLKVCAGSLIKDLRRQRLRISSHEMAVPPVSSEEEGTGMDIYADTSHDDMEIIREIDSALGQEFERKANDQFQMIERLKPVARNDYRFRQEVLRIEAAAAVKGIKLDGDQMAILVSKNLGIDPTLSHGAYRSRKSRADRQFWFLFLDEVYDSAVAANADLEEVRVCICEMGYWDQVGKETWAAWHAAVERMER